jgi:hypothetical protein
VDGRQLELPDKAQSYYEPCKTRPDFLYVRDQTAVYVDGPHHEYAHRKERDATQTACMEDRGWTVVRFAAGGEWEATVSQWPSVFGTQRSTGRRTDRSEAKPSFDESLFPSDWRAVLRTVSEQGIQVEPGRDVMSAGKIVGKTVAELRLDGRIVDVVDARAATSREVVQAITESGRAATAGDPSASECSQLLSAAVGARG